MMLRKVAFHVGMGIAILGGLVIGGVPLLIGFILGLLIRKYSLSRILAISIVTFLFILSWNYGGIGNSSFKVSLHNAITLGGKSPLWLNAVFSLLFTVCGGDLAKYIERHREKERTSRS